MDLLACRVAACYTPHDGRPVKEEREMRRASVSIQGVISAYLEDMTLYANLEPRGTGARRRR